jgi:antitoxin component of MazEF toxin-antitoxin module
MSVEFDPDSGEVTASRVIGRSGNSIVVRLPPQMLKTAGFGEGDDVELTAESGGRITITPDEEVNQEESRSE